MTSFLKQWLLLTAILFASATLYGVVSKHHNSLGVVSYESNPYTYKIGSVIAGFDIDDGKGTVIRLQPLATYNLFSEDILFCGDPTDTFDGLHNPVAITYETMVHRTVRGIGCHELIRADELKDKKEK